MSRPGSRTGWLGGAAVVIAAFGYLLYTGIGENLVYFVTPTELLARGPQAYEAPIRLGGDVKPGTARCTFRCSLVAHLRRCSVTVWASWWRVGYESPVCSSRPT
jgi:cytochrome c-type biogenesis protein CcmE